MTQVSGTLLSACELQLPKGWQLGAGAPPGRLKGDKISPTLRPRSFPGCLPGSAPWGCNISVEIQPPAVAVPFPCNPVPLLRCSLLNATLVNTVSDMRVVSLVSKRDYKGMKCPSHRMLCSEMSWVWSLWGKGSSSLHNLISPGLVTKHSHSSSGCWEF